MERIRPLSTPAELMFLSLLIVPMLPLACSSQKWVVSERGVVRASGVEGSTSTHENFPQPPFPAESTCPHCCINPTAVRPSVVLRHAISVALRTSRILQDLMSSSHIVQNVIDPLSTAYNTAQELYWGNGSDVVPRGNTFAYRTIIRKICLGILEEYCL